MVLLGPKSGQYRRTIDYRPPEVAALAQRPARPSPTAWLAERGEGRRRSRPIGATLPAGRARGPPEDDPRPEVRRWSSMPIVRRGDPWPCGSSAPGAVCMVHRSGVELSPPASCARPEPRPRGPQPRHRPGLAGAPGGVDLEERALLPQLQNVRPPPAQPLVQHRQPAAVQRAVDGKPPAPWPAASPRTRAAGRRGRRRARGTAHGRSSGGPGSTRLGRGRQPDRADPATDSSSASAGSTRRAAQSPGASIPASAAAARASGDTEPPDRLQCDMHAA